MVEGKGTPRTGDALSLLLLALGVSAFHFRGLQPGRTFLAVDLSNNNLPWLSGAPQPLQNWLISDPVYQTYPFLVHAVESLRRGSWPLWNPQILTGHPSFADPLAQSFYPLFLLLGWLLGPARGLAIGLWLHTLLASFLTYGLLRTIGCSRTGALLGGFTYALGGYMVNWFETAFWVSTMAWLPGVLWAFELARRRRSLPFVAAGALSFALAILGGQMAFAVTFALFFSLYVAGRSVESALLGRGWRWDIAAAAAILWLGSLVGSVQLLPFLEFLGMSHRASPSALDPLPVQQLVALIVPNAFGNPSSPVDYWGGLNFCEGVVYPGVPALLLAILAPVVARDFFSAYLVGLAAMIVLFAVGAPGAELLAAAPPLSYLSLHRTMFLLPLVMAMLVGSSMGRQPPHPWVLCTAAAIPVGAAAAFLRLGPPPVVDHWGESSPELLRAFSLLLATVLLLETRRRFRRLRAPADGLLVMLLFLDLFSFGHDFNPTGQIADLMQPTPALHYLEAHPSEGRVAVLQRGDRLTLGPNVASVFGLREAGGYSSLTSASLQRLVDAGDPKGGGTGIAYWLGLNRNIVFLSRPSPRLLDLLAVDRLISPTPIEGLSGVYGGELFVYDRANPLPRARVVYGAEWIPDDSRATARLLDEGFDLPNRAVVAEQVDLPSIAGLRGRAAQILRSDAEDVIVRATTDRPGLLVLSDQYHPGWRAYLDGRPVPIVRANLVARAVQLPVGVHDVAFRFEPASLRLGILASGAGIVLLLLVSAGRLLVRRP